MKNLVLIGMRGSGKSTIGKILAKKMNRDFWDSDREIEKQYGESISQIFEKKGEAFFRTLEKKAVEKISQQKNAVIATGGGVILNDENIFRLKEKGIVIFLYVSINRIAQRIKGSHRPSLTGKTIETELAEIWEKRQDRYFSSADIVVEANGEFGEVIKKIMTKFDNFLAK